MDPTIVSSNVPAGSRRVPRLAVASLVLGILGLAGSVVVLGGLLAAVGLVLGLIHLRRSATARSMAWAGVGLSMGGLLCSAGVAVFLAVALPRMMPGMPVDRGPANYSSWVGKPAPDFEVIALDGSPKKLSDLRGQRVVLDFWATWCGPCVMEIPHLAKLQRQSGRGELSVVGLSREDRSVLKKFTETHDVPYLIASVGDMDLPEPYAGIRSIPTTFFIDESGVIRDVVVGYHDFTALEKLALGSAHSDSGTSR